MADSLQPGAAIHIRQGPFQGSDGTVTAIRGDTIACEVMLFGRVTVIDVARADVMVRPTQMTDAALADIEAMVARAARTRTANEHRRLKWLAARVREGVRDDQLAETSAAFEALEAEVEEAQDRAAREALERFHAALAPLDPTAQIAYWEAHRAEWLADARPRWLELFADELPDGDEPARREALSALFEQTGELRDRIDAHRRNASQWGDDLDGTTPIATEPVLEAQIAAAPDDATPYLVYADFLQDRGDPRGELIVAQHRGPLGEPAANRILRKHERYLLGGLAAHDEIVDVTWRLGFIERAQVIVRRAHEDASIEQAAIVRTLLALPSSRFLRELELGIASIHEETAGAELLAALVEAGARPTLRRLRLFFDPEEEMLSWTYTGDLGPLWSLYPNLATLDITAGSIELGRIDLPVLATLRIETCALSSDNATAVLEAKLPALRQLELWFGDPERGATAGIAHAQALLQAPWKLESLGLVNTAFTDELCELLAAAPLVAQLRRLDLSRGTLTDDGARTLANLLGERAPQLETLDVSNGYLTDDGIAVLEALDIEIIADDQRQAELYDGEYRRYVAVGE